MADILGRAIVARAEGGAAAEAVNALVTTDQPDLRGGIHFVNTDRHATYVDGKAYRAALRRLRRRLGWPELARGSYDRVKAPGRAEAAA
jgi:hypothetical protein